MSSDSESASEHDPYEGTNSDSDKDYSPANERPNLQFQLPINSSSEEDLNHTLNEVENGKKNVWRCLWKRTIQKSKRVKGEPYVNVAGTHKPGQQMQL
jgi:hypothetical protein